MSSADLDTIDILRERLKEYRQMLEICFHFIYKTSDDSDETANRILARLDSYGIGSEEPKVQFKKED